MNKTQIYSLISSSLSKAIHLTFFSSKYHPFATKHDSILPTHFFNVDFKLFLWNAFKDHLGSCIFFCFIVNEADTFSLTFEYTYIMTQRQLVYLSKQCGTITIDSAEQQFQCAKVDVLNLFQEKKYSEYHFSAYIRLHRKVDLLSHSEKLYLSLAAVNLCNCLSVIYVHSKPLTHHMIPNVERFSHFFVRFLLHLSFSRGVLTSFHKTS